MSGLVIGHNLGAMSALSALNANSNALNSALQQLSTGKKINSAADDASGYAISQKMQAQISGLNQASQNAQDGISMIQTASGALDQTTSILQQMRQLAVQASNSTATDADRQDLQTEFNQLASQINNIGNTTQFNTQNLLDGGIGQNSGSIVTNATAASLTAASASAGGTSTTKLVINNQTFDLSQAGALAKVTSGADTTDIQADIAALGNVTSGSTKLSDVVNISANASGALTFTTKATGSSATIQIAGGDGADAALGLSGTVGTGAGDDNLVQGVNTTVQQSGLQASNALTAADVSIANGATFTIALGTANSSPITVDLNNTGSALNFATSTASSTQDQQAAEAGVVNAVNAALQQAGISSQVQASLGTNGNLQFVSSTGQNIYLSDGTGSPLAALGFTGTTATPGDLQDNKNIQVDAGPGAEGIGFTATFQIGANSGQTMSITIGDMRAAALGITGNAGEQGYSAQNNVNDGIDNTNTEAALDITTVASADGAISKIDNAIQTVTTEQANLGAVQNRLTSTISNLSSTSQNLTTADSGITDTDMASEMASYTQDSVLQQAAVSMLAQANQQPQLVLKLLG